MGKNPQKAVLTSHSIQRTKDRVGISKKIAEKNAQKALQHGLTHAETKGSLHRYLDHVYLARETANNIRVYNHYIYLFCGSILITILPLPTNLCPVADKLQKEKNCEKGEPA